MMKTDNAPKPTAAGGKRIGSLDALRGLAALYVLGFHYTVRFEEDYGHSSRLPFYVESGDLAVCLFFMISGFVIFMTLEKTKAWQDFVVSRFSRIYPAYWAAMIATFAVTNIVGLPGRTFGLDIAVQNLAMVHGLWGVPHIDGVYWSLELEICFYACMLFLFSINALKHIGPVMLGWMALSYFSPELLAPLPERIATVVQRFFLLQHIAWFCVGMVFYRRWKTGAFTKLDWLVLAFWPLCVWRLWDTHTKTAIIIASAFSLVFILAVSGRAKFLERRAFTWLGSVSYSLYLIHNNIGWVAINAMKKAGLTWPVYLPVTLGLALAMAWALHHAVEKPVMELVRVWWKQKSAKA